MTFVLGAVVGKPVLQSRSPEMHRSGLNQLGVSGAYTRVAADSMVEALELLRAIGARGCNVTAPFKQAAAALATRLDDTAKLLGAANTLVFSGDEVNASNTDPDGVAGTLRDLDLLNRPGAGVVLGTGGAARAAAIALHRGGWKVNVIGRDPNGLREMQQIVPCEVYQFSSISTVIARSTLLISCLSTAETVVPDESLHAGLTVVDAVYSQETALMRAARDRGCRVADGLSWLRHQGSQSFGQIFGAASAVSLPAPAARPWPLLIALHGAMGVGKTSVGRLLSAQLGLPFVDLDSAIEKRSGMSVSMMFETKGERYFRELESEELANQRQPAVLACGGGTVLSSENRDFLREHALNIWLWASPTILAARLGNSESRPLLANKALEPTLATIIRDRTRHYAEVSDLVLSCAHRSPEEVTKRLYDEICFARNS